MANSGLVVGGMTGALVTKGMGGVTVEVVVPIQRSGGGSSVVVPQAILVAKALVQIKHVNPIVSRITILTHNLIVKSTIPVKVRKIAISLKAIVSGMDILTHVRGLSLKISSGGIDIDDS